MTAPKQFKLAATDIQSLAEGHGACFATDYITVEGNPVFFMYREEPDNDVDSGWRFMSGLEDEDYMNDANNLDAYDVNTIANYDPSIIPYLHAPVGTAYERGPNVDEFTLITDWEQPEA